MTFPNCIPARIGAVLLCLSLLFGTAAAAAPKPLTFGIYTTGDMQGRCAAQQALTGAATDSSYLRVASAMAQERSAMDGALLLDSGDAVDISRSGDRGASTALALRAIGYDAFIPATDEFRLTSQEQAAFYQTLRSSSKAGQPVSMLSANYLDAKNQAPEYTAYEVFSLPVGPRTVRVGVLGFGAIDAARQVPASHYAGHAFSHSGNVHGDYAWEWENYWKKQLEQEECDLVVVVCHAEADTLTQFAAQTTGIDLLVGGADSPTAMTLPNRDGEHIPCVSGGGSALTRTTVTLSPGGGVQVGDSVLLSLSDYEENTALKQALSPLQSAAADTAIRPIGRLSGQWEDSGSLLDTQTDTTDLVARSMLWASGADVALLSPGSLKGKPISSRFSRGAGSISLSARDCALLLPDPSPLVMVELTAGEIYAWLDTCASRYTVSENGAVSGGSNADVLYGLSYELYLGSSAGQRVSALSDGQNVIPDSQVLRVALPASRLMDPYFPEATPVWSAATDRRFGPYGGSMSDVLAAYVEYQSDQYGSVRPQRDSTWAIYTSTNNGPLNRLEFVTMLYDIAGQPKPGADAAFIDVTGSPAVVWAAETGVVSGNGQGRFYPTQIITREQAAAMLYQYAKSLGLSTPSSGPSITALLDYSSISPWARPSVEFCIRTGALPAAGLHQDLFLPQNTLTRSEAKFYLNRFSDYIVSH